MLLILEEYFKDHPIKRKIVEGLYDRGISVHDGKFYISDIELSISEVAKSFKVNRRTVYDTIKIVESTPGVKEIMSRLRPSPNLSGVAPLMGDQVATLYIARGYFSKVMSSLLECVRKYGSYVKEIYGRNQSRDNLILRTIFYRTVPKEIFEELGKIEGIERIVIESTSLDIDEAICTKCEVKICSNKLSTGIFEEKLPEY